MSNFHSIMAISAASFLMVSNPVAGETVDLDAVRAATEKYKDVNVALNEGYVRDPADHCISAAAEGLPAEWGAMGVHYIHMGRLGITAGEPRVNGNGTHTDFMEPGVLFYEPQADGGMELLGVENLVWQAAWGETGLPIPEINGRLYDTMTDDPVTAKDEAHNFEPHYDQHVWLFRENPAGELMPFNPMVNCEYHTGH